MLAVARSPATSIVGLASRCRAGRLRVREPSPIVRSRSSRIAAGPFAVEVPGVRREQVADLFAVLELPETRLDVHRQRLGGSGADATRVGIECSVV